MAGVAEEARMVRRSTYQGPCLYCSEGEPKVTFKGVDHVMPKAFGRFQQNLVLEKVCDACNNELSRVERVFARDSYEGHRRLDEGLKRKDEFEGLGERSAMGFRLEAGPLKGAFVGHRFDPAVGDLRYEILPQFRVRQENREKYYRVHELPKRDEIDRDGFTVGNGARIDFVAIQIDEAEAHRIYTERGYEPAGGERWQSTFEGESTVEMFGTMGDQHVRAIVKIAFNYFASQFGVGIARDPQFDVVRRYVRYGHAPDRRIIDPDTSRILIDEAIGVTRSRLCHIVTAEWTPEENRVLAQVSLFNTARYAVTLALGPFLILPPPDCMASGHVFNLADMSILQLRPWTRPGRGAALATPWRIRR